MIILKIFYFLCTTSESVQTTIALKSAVPLDLLLIIISYLFSMAHNISRACRAVIVLCVQIENYLGGARDSKLKICLKCHELRCII